MAVKIRLKRMGAKNNPVYRIVVADSRSPRDGKFIEEIGTYQPTSKNDNNVTLNVERSDYWVKQGAQPTHTAASLIRKVKRGAAVSA